MSIPKNQQKLLKFIEEKCHFENDILVTKKLYLKSSTGKIRVWQGYAGITDSDLAYDKKDNSGEWFKEAEWYDASKYINREELPAGTVGVYWTEYKQKNGKLTVSKPKILKTGKSIGRANYTTPFTQAVIGLKSDYDKKVRSGALEDEKHLVNADNINFDVIKNRKVGDEYPWRINAMLLHNVDNYWKKVKFPIIAQIKLDGSHLIIVNKSDDPTSPDFDTFTRGRKSYAGVDHLLKNLKLDPGVYISGELFSEGMSRQEISSQTRQEKSENVTKKLEFNVFDLWDANKPYQPFEERWKRAQKFCEKNSNKYIKCVESRKIEDKEEANEYLHEALNRGYEGLVLRNLDGKYEFGLSKSKRSYDSMKYKPREDDEFEIVGFKDGKGKNKGLIIFVAKTESGKKFNVTPKWSEEKRAKWFKEMSEDFTVKGKMATIEFDGYSDTGVPIQPYLIKFI